MTDKGEQAVDRISDKTPGYLRDILRRPAFLKMAFRRIKLFFSKYSVYLQCFKTFWTVNFLIFAEKTSEIRWKDIFTKKYYLRRILEKICLM